MNCTKHEEKEIKAELRKISAEFRAKGPTKEHREKMLEALKEAEAKSKEYRKRSRINYEDLHEIIY